MPDMAEPELDRILVPTPDGRSLDAYVAGPADGDVLLFQTGTPCAAIPFPPAVRTMAERGLRGFDLASIRIPVHVWQGRHDRMVPYAHGEWLAGHVTTAIPHLHEDHGHLSLAVDSLGLILDELTASSGSRGRRRQPAGQGEDGPVRPHELGALLPTTEARLDG
jgi:hypothetical protein